MEMGPEPRKRDIELELQLLATEAELVALCREIRATRWTIVAVGIGISIVILASKFIG